MPNIKSAKKRMKTSEKSRIANQSEKSKITSSRRKLYEAIADKNKASTDELFRTYCSVLDKAVKKGVLKANNANRRKSRAAVKIAAI